MATNSVETIESIEKANYINEEVASLYQIIRNHFSVDAQELLKDFPEELKNPEKGNYTKLVEILSYDSVYDLSFLDPNQQVACLIETLDEMYHPLIQSFVELNPNFSSIEFYAYLQERAGMESKQATVYVSSTSSIKDIKGVQVKVNESICEGVQIEIDHVLYDFAILKKEIGGHVNS